MTKDQGGHESHGGREDLGASTAQQLSHDDLVDRLRKLRCFVAMFYGEGQADCVAMDQAIAVVERQPFWG